MAISNYAESALLNGVLRATTFTAPTSVYVKLHTGDPGGAGTANAASNTTRQVVTFAAPSGTQPTSAASNVACTWTSVPTAETYSYVSLWDNSTAGNCLWSGALTTAKTVGVGDTFTIASGSLTVSLT